MGSAKLSTEILKDTWLIVRASVSEDEIMNLLKNRHFRESEYSNKALGLREVLSLKRDGKMYNFKGGTCYERDGY